MTHDEAKALHLAACEKYNKASRHRDICESALRGATVNHAEAKRQYDDTLRILDQFNLAMVLGAVDSFPLAGEPPAGGSGGRAGSE